MLWQVWGPRHCQLKEMGGCEVVVREEPVLERCAPRQSTLEGTGRQKSRCSPPACNQHSCHLKVRCVVCGNVTSRLPRAGTGDQLRCADLVF